MAATAQGGLKPLAKDIEIRKHRLVADEAEADGGADAGPTPQELLDAALASCTALTLDMYAKRKGWPVEHLRVEVEHGEEQGIYRFRRAIHVEGSLDEEQRKRLLQIAERCPVHRLLAGQTEIISRVI